MVQSNGWLSSEGYSVSYYDMIADQNREKFNLHLSQWRVVLHAMSRFSARRESLHHSCSIHLLSKTKELCGMAGETSQISLTCSSYALLFSCSFLW